MRQNMRRKTALVACAPLTLLLGLLRRRSACRRTRGATGKYLRGDRLQGDRTRVLALPSADMAAVCSGRALRGRAMHQFELCWAVLPRRV